MLGVNRHFDMFCIQEELTRLMKKEVHCRSIWKHLNTLYDMEALQENEQLPFPNNYEDFSLPNDFDDLKQQRMSGVVADRLSGDSSAASMDSADDGAPSLPKTPGRSEAAGAKTKVKVEERRETREKDKDKDVDNKTPKPKRNVKDMRSEDKSKASTSTTKKRRSQVQ